MDSHGTLLTRQDVHRSSFLWDAHLEGEVCTCSIYVVERWAEFNFEVLIIMWYSNYYLQEVPGVLTCCHRDKGVLEGGLDPRIISLMWG